MRRGDVNRAEQLLRESLQKNSKFGDNRLLLAQTHYYRFLKFCQQRGKVREDLLGKTLDILEGLENDYRVRLVKAGLYLSIFSMRDDISEMKKNRILGIFDVKDFHAFRYQAYQWYREATRYEPLSMRVNYGIARCRALNGNMERAMEHLQKYSSRLPGDARPYYAMGKLRFETGEWEEARGFFREAIDHDSRYFPAYYMMLVCFEQEKQKESGIRKWIDSVAGKKEEGREEFLYRARNRFRSPVFKAGSDMDQYFMIRYL
jgi:tetratricopeptide (TPR) repeat protein